MPHILSRTYSSPNLKANGRYRDEWESQQERHGYGDDGPEEDDDFYVIGDRVHVDGYRLASVAYFGEVEFAPGDWVGVVLDDPSGKHDGRIQGREYFQCAPFHGLFVRPHRVSRIPDSALGSSATSSRISTPLSRRITPSRSPGASTVDSYFYDEDYRPERRPTADSLMRKLRSIDEKRSPPTPVTTISDAASSPLAGDTSSRASRHQGFTTGHRQPGTPRAGILKRTPQARSHSIEPPRRGSQELFHTSYGQQRSSGAGRPSSSSAHHNSSVFNFRPRRAQLDEFDGDMTANGAAVTTRHGYNHYPERYTPSASLVDLTSEPLRLGDRVSVRTERGAEMVGILRYLGETEFATGEWAGVELDEPKGKNDGSVLGHRYFYSPRNYGLFVPAVRVKKYFQHQSQSGPHIFNSMRSTITSPPPPPMASYMYTDGSGGSSASRSPATSSSRERVTSSSSSPLSHSSPYYNLLRTTSTSPADSSQRSSYRANQSIDSDAIGSRGRTTGPALRSNNNLLNQQWPPSGNGDRSSSSNFFNESSMRPKFDRNDSELMPKKSSQESPISSARVTAANISSPKPRSVKYTFSSSTFHGNPIAFRTVEYD